MIATSPTWPTSADRSCRVRTTTLASTDRARAPQVRHASPSLNFEALYFFQYFSHLSPPPSGPSLHLSRGRLEWIEIVVQSVGLIVELPLDDPWPNAYKDVDLEDSRTDTTRRIPGATVTTCGKAVACWY